MRDYLLDLVEHTFDLGCIDLVKITGTTAQWHVNGSGTGKRAECFFAGFTHTPGK